VNFALLTCRRRWVAIAALLVVAVGLASRSRSVPLPELVRAYAGDTLWAVLVFLLLAFLRPKARVLWLAGIALAIAFCVEFLQLYQAPWLNTIRGTLPGRLVLGQGFLFSDLICYTFGIAAAAIVYQAFTERGARDLNTISCAAFLILITVAVFAANSGQVSQLFWFADKVPGKDKTGHFLLMGGLAFFAVLAIAPRLKMPIGKSTLVVLVTLSVLIATEEGSQYFISTRSFSIADLVCSLAGVAILGGVAWFIVSRPKASV